MPFIPLDPSEQEAFKEPCRSREHDPPNMLVLRGPAKWRCPSCGQETMLIPPTVRWCTTPTEWLDLPYASNHRDDGGISASFGR